MSLSGRVVRPAGGAWKIYAAPSIAPTPSLTIAMPTCDCCVSYTKLGVKPALRQAASRPSYSCGITARSKKIRRSPARSSRHSSSRLARRWSVRISTTHGAVITGCARMLPSPGSKPTCTPMPTSMTLRSSASICGTECISWRCTFKAGYSACRRISAGGRKGKLVYSTRPIEMRNSRSPATSRVRRSARCSCSKIFDVSQCSTAPAGVSATLRPSRVNSAVPTVSSSLLICWLRAGWVMKARSAALRKCSSLARMEK